MSTALIGYTGFVGGALARKTRFDDYYRSTNIQDIVQKHYDLIVSAGVYSLKWKANLDPDSDTRAIRQLMDALDFVETRLFVLISTIDVYANPTGVDEDSPLYPREMMPYGRNRWELEEYIRDRFDTLIVRLPNLFGEGLKKNVIYDLLNNHEIEKINQNAVLQWYSVETLWDDVQRALCNNLRLLNVATEPWLTRDLATQIFEMRLPTQQPRSAPVYDFHTKHARLWGKTGPYLYSKSEVRRQLKQFVALARKSSQT